ncbi:AB hydrolase superfamily protein [Lachnellula suecica]|uniref:AB hydrolase superfamily protein n=1 Tax=Lachnellula suecica TaxID=602035 RepID=A0A8T9C225_9HELO|nr:AB hydrolase superfamily protein [Lachnellula suecica]
MSEIQPLMNALHPSVADRVDPQFAEIYTKYQAPRLRADQVTYEEYNADRSKYTFAIAPGPTPEVGCIKLFQIPVSEPAGEITVQLFAPTVEAIEAGSFRTADGKLPAHVNFHGGGFVIGNLKSDEPWCRKVCQAVGCIILNVDYRLAPEYPHPVPLTDSWTALKWVFDNAQKLLIDTSRVSIGGVSAGGNLAAVLALLARDEPDMPKLVLQMLICPAVDTRFIPLEGPCDPSVPYESYIKDEFAPCLPLNRLRWFYNLWLGTDMEKRKKTTADFHASPILASSHADLAPASVHIAGVDTLRSEGIAYHELLKKSCTPSTLKIYEGCGHPFGGWDGELDKAKEFVQDTISALKFGNKV